MHFWAPAYREDRAPDRRSRNAHLKLHESLFGRAGRARREISVPRGTAAVGLRCVFAASRSLSERRTPRLPIVLTHASVASSSASSRASRAALASCNRCRHLGALLATGGGHPEETAKLYTNGSCCSRTGHRLGRRSFLWTGSSGARQRTCDRCVRDGAGTSVRECSPGSAASSRRCHFGIKPGSPGRLPQRIRNSEISRITSASSRPRSSCCLHARNQSLQPKYDSSRARGFY